MDKIHRQAMDITAPRTSSRVAKPFRWTRKNRLIAAISGLLIVGLIVAVHMHVHRHDQSILADRYQVVYLVTGQIYFGKLQNASGTYLTLKNVFTLQNESDPASPAGDASSQSKIIKVSQQVYGPDDSMAIRADQVQFWQNLRDDSKVTKAINTAQ